jgi:aspartate-semialdehyde dehydrogenase
MTVAEIKEILSNSPGVTLQDNPEKFEYPMPLTSHDKDDVFVGRIRMDDSEANTINMWVVADNLRKGAATNAIQIAELLIQKGWFNA